MAVGDDAKAKGYLIVQTDGEDGKVRYGAREINRTRDYIALVWGLIPATAAAWRSKAGIRSGTAAPSGGNDGDIYFKIL